MKLESMEAWGWAWRNIAPPYNIQTIATKIAPLFYNLLHFLFFALCHSLDLTNTPELPDPPAKSGSILFTPHAFLKAKALAPSSPINLQVNVGQWRVRSEVGIRYRYIRDRCQLDCSINATDAEGFADVERPHLQHISTCKGSPIV